jgi:hypothetical protein
MADFLEETRRQIADRLKELEPLANEYHRLTAAASALEGAVGAAASAVVGAAGSAAGSVRASVTRTPSRRGPGRPRGSSGKTATAAPPAKKRGRPPGSTNKAAAPARKPRRTGRRKGSGGRAAQALSFIKAQPGITILELATKMGIKSQYLYRLLPPLEQDGKITKQGKGLYPK